MDLAPEIDHALVGIGIDRVAAMRVRAGQRKVVGLADVFAVKSIDLGIGGIARQRQSAAQRGPYLQRAIIAMDLG